jgi:hypothetical protein
MKEPRATQQAPARTSVPAALTPFELAREARIRSNQERCAGLGIPGLRVPAPVQAAPRRLRSGPRPSKGEGSRRSSRLANLPAPHLSLEEEEEEEWGDRTRTVKKLRAAAQEAVHPAEGDGEPAFSSHADVPASGSGAVKAGSTRSLLAAVPQLASRLGELIHPTDGTGAFKNAATESLYGARRQISFNKYSGVQEWKNAVALFVNVRGKAGCVRPARMCAPC